MKALKSLKEIGSYFKKDRLNLVILGITILILNLCTLLYAFFWGIILEKLMNKAFFEGVLILLIYLILSIVAILLNLYGDYLAAKITRGSIKNIQMSLFSKIIDLPAVAFEEHGIGEYTNRIYNDTDQLLNSFTSFINVISQLISVVFIVGVFFMISKVIAVELLVFGVVVYVVTRYFNPRMKKANEAYKQETDQLNKNTTQLLTGIREVKSLGIKERIKGILSVKFKAAFSASYDAAMISGYHNSTQWIVYSLIEFVVLFTSAFMFYKNVITIAIFVMVYSYFARIENAISNYTDFMNNYQKLSVSLTRISQILNNKLYDNEKFGNIHLKELQGEIEFKNVELMYDHDEHLTLRGVSLKIKPNKKTAIVGVSGSGKSSLFNLLLHYFNPTSGQILIDGTNLEDLDENCLRNSIGVIRQEPFLFNMSIMDNFRIVKENVTLSEVRKVCKDAYIDNYIMELPKGYETVIGENGVNLSVGQKQRLAIARTLLKDSKILLFDEATSSLDNKSQSYVKKTIDKLAVNHTIVIIAHRLSTIVDADEIVLMDKGKIVAKGTHKTLLKNPKYKELYKPEIIE